MADQKITITQLDLVALQALKAAGGGRLNGSGRVTLINTGYELPPYRVERLLRHKMCELAEDGLFEGYSQTIRAVI